MGSRVLCVAAITFAAMVCGATVPPANPASEKWEAPADAAAKVNPGSKNRAAIVHGRKLFNHTCARCHEEDGSGQNGGAANLRCPQVQSQSDGALFWKVRVGNTTNGMPSFTALPENDRWDIVTFLRTLRQPCDTPSSNGEKKDTPPNSDEHKPQ
ncbi:MAG: c-type cytochrome [Terriglobales bacterium]